MYIGIAYCDNCTPCINCVHRFGSGNSTQPVWLDAETLNCDHNRFHVLQCGHGDFGAINCGHAQDVAVACCKLPWK